MTTRKRIALLCLAVVCLSTVASAQNDMSHFITRSGNKLMEGNREYRFVSFNIPNLHLVEDNMAFDATNEWRFPDEFEVTDALTSVKRMGGRAVRTYVISICSSTGQNAIPCHVTKPGEFNEEAFRALDKVLEVANRVGVRVIIPLVDNWRWWGGAEQYAGQRGKPVDAFWTDRQLIDDFKKTVTYVLNRRNTYTGTLYRDDTAVLAWETGNELYAPYSWTKEIAAHIKSLDANHLVWDGYYIGSRPVIPEALDDPNIDIVSSHHYPAPNQGPGAMAADVDRFRREIGGKKVYVVGEFGFVPVSEMEKILDTVIRDGVSGAMTWSLRFRNRDGGFYWHSEPSGGNLFKAYHYPGFESGEAYEESAMFRLLSAKAFEIQGLKAPAASAPAPPRLLPIESIARISWQGSVGATSYDVERASKPAGPWSLVGLNVDETLVQYRPLFADDDAEPGATYYYRVRAKGPGGSSAPSNVVGPVRVESEFVVDELVDFSRIFAREGRVSLETTNARPYKEDAHRLKSSTGSWIMYRSRRPLGSATVLGFMEGEQRDFEFCASDDGTRFVKVEPKVETLKYGANPYGYKLPVRYRVEHFAPRARFLKIVFAGDAQIGRVELRSATRGTR
jgi:mannan endo-1,4-beta-mannosidase